MPCQFMSSTTSNKSQVQDIRLPSSAMQINNAYITHPQTGLAHETAVVVGRQTETGQIYNIQRIIVPTRDGNCTIPEHTHQFQIVYNEPVQSL